MEYNEQGHTRRDGIQLQFDWVKSQCKRFGIDRAIAWSIISRGWSVLAGPITVFFTANFLTQSEQGYYYTFSNILSLTLFFELGLSTVIVQFTSHERAHLEWVGAYLDGNDIAKARMGSLMRSALRWYCVASFLIILFILPIGYYFFATSDPHTEVKWQFPWIFVCVLTALNCLLSPIWAILEGCGLVAKVASVRFGQQIVASICLWIMLGGQLHLLAAAGSALGTLIISVLWLYKVPGRFLFDIYRTRSVGIRLNWWQEVWPMQWRIGLSWLTGLFVYHIFNPILFKYHGPVIAGQWGMSMVLAQAFSPLGTAWVNTRAPRFGMLAAKGDYQTLDRETRACLLQSLSFMVTGSIIIFLCITCIHSLNNPWAIQYAQRIVSPGLFATMAVVPLLYHSGFVLAAYLRAHKEDPMYSVSVLYAVVTALGAWFAGRAFGMWGIAISSLFGVTCCWLLGAIIVFKKRRAKFLENKTAIPGFIRGDTCE